MENIIIRLEPEFGVVISSPWEGNSLVLKMGMEEALSDHFSEEGSDDERKTNSLLNHIRENYPEAELREIKTRKGKLLITLSISSREALDRFCADDTIKVKAIMPKVSVPWKGGNVNIDKDFEESWRYFKVRGGNGVWRAHALIEHLAEGYDASLKGMRNEGEKLVAILSFSAKDRDEFDRFCEEHS